MTAGYDIQRLQAGHAERLERLHRRVQRTRPYAGRSSPAETLRRAESAHSNISLGLFDGVTLAGYILAAAENARENLCALGLQDVADDLPATAVFVVDFAVAAQDRAAASKLLFRFSQMLSERDDLRALPLCFACHDELAVELARRSGFFRRLGFRLARQVRIAEPATSHPLHVLVLERQHGRSRDRSRSLRDSLCSIRTFTDRGSRIEVGLIQTTEGWALLEPYWNPLLALSRGATALQTYDYQRIWWSHLGTACDLWIVVALEDGSPTAIAPL